jgi:hypothetical protein
MTVFEGNSEDARATRSAWRVAGYFAASGILGFFSGSLIGLLPGIIAFRSEPSRVILWVRFDQFLAIMAFSCGLASLAIFRLIARNPALVLSMVAVVVGSYPWVLISTVTGEGDWFRVGGALAGLVASLVVSVLLVMIRRCALGPRVAAGQEG